MLGFELRQLTECKPSLANMERAGESIDRIKSGGKLILLNPSHGCESDSRDMGEVSLCPSVLMSAVLQPITDITHAFSPFHDGKYIISEYYTGTGSSGKVKCSRLEIE
jgi:hypothetical protein